MIGAENWCQFLDFATKFLVTRPSLRQYLTPKRFLMTRIDSGERSPLTSRLKVPIVEVSASKKHRKKQQATTNSKQRHTRSSLNLQSMTIIGIHTYSTTSYSTLLFSSVLYLAHVKSRNKESNHNDIYTINAAQSKAIGRSFTESGINAS